MRRRDALLNALRFGQTRHLQEGWVLSTARLRRAGETVCPRTISAAWVPYAHLKFVASTRRSGRGVLICVHCEPHND